MIAKISNYIKSSIEEMKKVTWPTKKETYNYTLLVILISLGVAAFLGALDYVFSTLLQIAINSKL
jgi:preprotein translocase subunit SecE